jgi:hypothetical protein
VRGPDPKIAARGASQQPATRHRPRAQPKPPAAAEDRRRRNRWRRSCRRRSHGWRNSKLRPCFRAQSPGFAVKPSWFTLIDPLFPEPQPAAAGEGCGAPGGGHPGAHQHPPDRRCERTLNPKLLFGGTPWRFLIWCFMPRSCRTCCSTARRVRGRPRPDSPLHTSYTGILYLHFGSLFLSLHWLVIALNFWRLWPILISIDIYMLHCRIAIVVPILP